MTLFDSKDALKIAVAQLNLTVGDMTGNAEKIIAASKAAYAQGVRLVLTPELSICGYPPEDLLLRTAFIQACDAAVSHVALALAAYPDLHVVVGHPQGTDVRTKSTAIQMRTNQASVLSGGKVIASYAKRELPNYQVFDERRYFAAGHAPCVIDVQGTRVGLLICEDAWFDAPCQAAKAAGAEVLAVINASPFHLGKQAERIERMRDGALLTGLPLIYAHCVGGQDEIVFDGGSFALNANGTLADRAKSFAEDVWLVDWQAKPSVTVQDDLSDLWQALVLGVRDYVNKNGFPSIILGLSGGIDSALVLAIAVDALGASRVRCVMMPSPYTAEISWVDARDMAKRMGVRYDELSIIPEFDAFKATLAKEFAGLAEDATEENIQARIRGTLLMALSNKFGSIVLTTGNKSEMATGYCTLYGDMAGGFAVIKDVAKTTVFKLAHWRNQNDPFSMGANPIPERIITRPPSAELRADQTDQDSLPPYEVLDAILERYMENDQSIDEIVAAGFAPADVERVTKLIKINEYKRRQAPIGIRVTHRSFGKDWRYPITSKFRA
ncbi:MAG: NAD+ synthase [Cytophagales bacterium]|nr:NAD+ synthase [Cytophagales bacterium]